MILKHPQSFCKSAWDYGCYADCIIKLASEISGFPFNCQNLGKGYDIGLDAGLIDFNQNDYSDKNNFYVNDAGKFLSKLIGKPVTCRHEAANYIPKSNEFCIDFYAKSITDGQRGIGHFVYITDPIQNSRTVAEGFVYSKRIFTIGK